MNGVLHVLGREVEWCFVQRAVQRGSEKHHVWMNVCWSFPHYYTLREHYWVSGTFPEEQKDQLFWSADPCPRVQGWNRKKVTCAHVMQNQKCNSKCARVAMETQRHWVTKSAWRMERKLCREWPRSSKGLTRKGRSRPWHSKPDGVSCGIELGVGAVHDFKSHKGLLKNY